jgi:Zn-finger nucleic acid-binding protein
MPSRQIPKTAHKENSDVKCPVCTTANLVMAERQGVEIDYCPECRGVWLDRGELDKIIERAIPQELAPPTQPQYTPHQGRNYGNDHPAVYGHGQGYGHGNKPHRKKSFLEELFD